MARSQLQKGSQGSDVKYLQEFLNTQGHNLTVDGIFGDNTLAAVKDYQSKNGLAVDGIVGTNTWGSIDKLSAGSGSGSSGSTSATASNPFTYGDYKESDVVKNAGTAAQNAANAVANYGSFTYGNESLYNDVMNKILNREDFTYDFNGDALYQQYKDKYIKQGKMAMGDAIGQASAMTGGYGNSYAQSVGQQAYQAQLENLNDIIPELYQMALDKYNMDGQDLYNQFGMLQSDRSQKYGEWSDGYNRLIADRDYTQGVYDSERKYDRGVYDSDRGVAYDQHRDAIADEQWQAAMDYQKERDKVEDEQWQKQYDAAYGNKLQDGSVDTVPNTGTTDSGVKYDNGGYGSDVVKKAQAYVGASTDGKWGPASTAAAKAKGYNSLAEVVKAMGGGGTTINTQSASIQSFKSRVVPESSHDAIARKMYGPYKAYLAVELAKDNALSEDEKIYLIQYYGITESDMKYARDKGYDI